MEGKVYRRRETGLVDNWYSEISSCFIIRVKGRMPRSSEGWQRQPEI